MSILSSQIPTIEETHYCTSGGIQITKRSSLLDVETATDTILKEIDFKKGALFSSRYEYPGRYSRWDVGFTNPLIEVRGSGKKFTLSAQNQKGEFILDLLVESLRNVPEITSLEYHQRIITGTIEENSQVFDEEKRSQQPSIFTVIRNIKSLFASSEDKYLGLYGAFGYDLIFQFESIEKKLNRQPDQSDLVLYLPDVLVVVDHQLEIAYQISYEFNYRGKSTMGMSRDTRHVKYISSTDVKAPEYKHGHYTQIVKKALKSFKSGDLFEVVPSQVIYEKCESKPSAVFNRLQEINPSPYGFIVNLGTEFLVGSSPEMYVRVEKNRVETCPISGTIKRGKNALEDAKQIQKLLNSAKDEAELTMCTDVDRNDKSRICEAGSVQVIGRRQIEKYSHLIHTVDHVEGRLREGFDALDAFLTHMWAVTITGAPKRAAIQWIENHEQSPRTWYGGAVGWYHFNGSLNTGLTLRTIKLKNGMAEIRVGATLLYDSIPEAEEQETLTKAAGLVQAIKETDGKITGINPLFQSGKGKKVLIVDHEDSFVHTLANYIKQTGAQNLIVRSPVAREELKNNPSYDLVVLSPGPGYPDQFQLRNTIQLCIEKEIPIFGVCLGLQGIVEYFGGTLNILDTPQHGKPSYVRQTEESDMWDGLPQKFEVSRYHSLYAEHIPEDIIVTAVSDDDDVVMAIEHKELPISAVQFHPESILTIGNEIGMKIINNVMKKIK